MAVAYFCMEFGLREDLLTYAGGLGILAGDHLKSAADLGLPLVGIGLLWRQGYTTQLVNDEGRPMDAYPNYTYPFLHDTGIKIQVEVEGRPLAAKLWQAMKQNSVRLYLLDANLPENTRADRSITARLYRGGAADRIAQEILLGIGGVRALRKLGVDVTLYHFNEGHAVFAGVELIREKMSAGMSFADAWRATRNQIVFTTHTPVPAGNELHDHGLLATLGAYNGLTYQEMAHLGGDPFAMTVAGLRLARTANAVSEQHGHVARRMWAGVSDAAPIIHITNGVHPGTWQSPEIRAAFQSGGDLWQTHHTATQEMCHILGRRFGTWLNPDVLTVGFARRATAYKRHELIMRYTGRIEPLLHSSTLQLIFAGKAHPQDEEGRTAVRRLVEWSRRFPDCVVFLPDYDMPLGRLLTQGCDIWLNNPRRGQEASGTSGMKAAMNGVLNLSMPEGWWAEGCSHGVNGWSVTSPASARDTEEQDDLDAQALYQVLESEVIPTYYNNRPRWVQMMAASIDMAQTHFSSQRMVAEYRDLMYHVPRPLQV